MATNKHATIRYHALDLCFSNFGRRFYIEDLVDACNNALFEFEGIEDGVKRRQIFDDMRFMESDQGWSIPLERIKDGRRVYYQYSDKKFSIKKQAINESEANQLKETLSILNRFKGMPQFEWMEELLVRIDSTFKLKSQSDNPIVGFEQNPYLKGLDFFSDIFNAIQYKRVIDVTYQSFRQLEPQRIRAHPYYLKQYNSRWFLFAYNEAVKSISNLALDRISNIEESSTPYIENNEINFEEYFEDVVGVTVNEETEPRKVVIHVNKELLPYIESKPIHGSQKIIEHDDSGVVIELSLQVNYEFISLIFSFGEKIKVIAPSELITIIKSKAEKVLKNYS